MLGLSLPSGGSSSSPDGWVYLRGGEPPASAERLVEILAVGDVMPGRRFSYAPGIFDHVAEALQGAELSIGNLEGAVADSPAEGTTLSLVLPPETPATLAEAGFDLLSLANNHALDAGTEGLAETRRRLLAAGVEPVESDHAILREIDGLTFAFLAWNDLATENVDDILAAVSDADAEADQVIVLVHWGQEYVRHPVLPQHQLADDLLAAGADIVLGSHPHVVQDVQVVDPDPPEGQPKVVAYSLGNFVFDQGWDDTAQGLALRLLFDDEGLRAAQALPLWTAPRPRWMAPQDAAPLLDRILAEERMSFTCTANACSAVPAAGASGLGIFEQGKIDLTGDGDPESIELRGQRVQIVQAGQIAWCSPPQWQVRDLALGDPNDDGRYELVLALDQTGRHGEVTSHPFIVGYRGGIYRELWGGSAVHLPILEVELSDLDGDGADDLAAVEASTDGSDRYVTIWQWHGWGFSQAWRSLPGDYSDLSVMPAEKGHPLRLSVAAGP